MNGLHEGLYVMRSMALVVQVINIVLLLALLYVYVRNYRQFKSRFTVGLIFFATMFLIQNIVWVLFTVFLKEMRSPTMGFPIFALTVMETLGLVVLLWITWE